MQECFNVELWLLWPILGNMPVGNMERLKCTFKVYQHIYLCIHLLIAIVACCLMVFCSIYNVNRAKLKVAHARHSFESFNQKWSAVQPIIICICMYVCIYVDTLTFVKDQITSKMGIHYKTEHSAQCRLVVSLLYIGHSPSFLHAFRMGLT